MLLMRCSHTLVTLLLALTFSGLPVSVKADPSPLQSSNVIDRIAQNQSSPQSPDPSATEQLFEGEGNSPDQEIVSDPLNSPFPVPWSWVVEGYTNPSNSPQLRYYRSPALISPDGQLSAYSRISMEMKPQWYQSRISSVMFLEDLKTGELKLISGSSPLSNHPLQLQEEADQPGTMSMLIPVSWSEDGKRLLSRQFEGVLSSSIASDYAVIWDRQQDKTYTVSPNNLDYSNAVLLGWSKQNPHQVLFQAGQLGDEHWSLYAVSPQGNTAIAQEDQPTVYGRVVQQVWSGEQTLTFNQ